MDPPDHFLHLWNFSSLALPASLLLPLFLLRSRSVGINLASGIMISICCQLIYVLSAPRRRHKSWIQIVSAWKWARKWDMLSLLLSSNLGGRHINTKTRKFLRFCYVNRKPAKYKLSLLVLYDSFFARKMSHLERQLVACENAVFVSKWLLPRLEYLVLDL